MEIVKKFNLINTHIVRNCYSSRCKYSLHTHTVELECCWGSNNVDNAGMVMDFGLIKDTIKKFIMLFDKSVLIWKKDNPEYIDFVKQTTDRWIEIPFSPSAEQLSAMYTYALTYFTKAIQFSNNEKGVKYLYTVYHETRTGRAKTTINDANTLIMDQQVLLEPGLFTWGPAFHDKDSVALHLPDMYDKIKTTPPEQQVVVGNKGGDNVFT